MPQNTLLPINQALHGYDMGHRLIASSIELNDAEKHEMLVQSDLSGSIVSDGFHQYMSGYPLSSGKYVFAYTWYADEMRRPGCVWTHSLILDNENAESIHSIWPLTNYFQRPQSNNSSDYEYDRIIYPKAQGDVAQPDLLLNSELTALVIEALYEDSTSAVVLPARRNLDLARFVCAIWDQQWPKLRNTFAFSTGSLELRKISGRMYDLQVMPLNSSSHTSSFESNIKVIAQSARKDRLPEWVQVIADDLYQGGSGKLRQFMRSYAANSKRVAFKNYSKVFSYYKAVCDGDGDLVGLANVVGEQFSSIKSAKKLKQHLFGGTSEQLVNENSFEDERILLSLAQVSVDAFDADSLNIASRVAQIAKYSPERLVEMAGALTDNVTTLFSKQLLAAITGELCSRDLLKKAPEDLIVHAVMSSPQFAVNKSVWQVSAWSQREIFNQLKEAIDSEWPYAKELVFAMLDASSDVVSSEVVSLFQDHTVFHALEWANTITSNFSSMPYGWKRAIKLKPRMILDWLQSITTIQANCAVLISNLIDPDSPIIQDYDLSIWHPLIKLDWTELSNDQSRSMAAFLLTLALKHKRLNVVEIMAKSFPVVHNSLTSSTLGKRQWEWLDRLLPDLGWFNNWDRCERLRRGVLLEVVESGLPLRQLTSGLSSKKQRRQLKATAKTMRLPDRLIKEM